ncbi:cupredoxin domain-containing protein [Patescibacteria group bacterium]|nr:cupredoxin domain-containing protein [Patescibacteria group bacterium]
MKYVFYGLIIFVLGFVGFLFLGNKSADTSSSQSANVSNTIQDSKVLKFSASITNRSYSPARIDVPFGSTVELTVKNNDNEQHGLFLQDFGVQEVVGPRQTKTIRFIANRQGESTTFCSVVHPEKLIINVN